MDTHKKVRTELVLFSGDADLESAGENMSFTGLPGRACELALIADMRAMIHSIISTSFSACRKYELPKKVSSRQKGRRQSTYIPFAEI